MSNTQKVRVWTAVVDAVVSTLTVVLTLFVKDEALRQLILPLLGSYQVVAVTLIVALTTTEVTELRLASQERIEALWRVKS